MVPRLEDGIKRLGARLHILFGGIGEILNLKLELLVVLVGISLDVVLNLAPYSAFERADIRPRKRSIELPIRDYRSSLTESVNDPVYLLECSGSGLGEEFLGPILPNLFPASLARATISRRIGSLD